jgi:hypothetical protein
MNKLSRSQMKQVVGGVRVICIRICPTPFDCGRVCLEIDI